MGEYFIDIEEIPVYAWIIIGVCVALIVAGIVVLATMSRFAHNKKRFEINDGRAHKMRDLSFGFDTLHGREDEPEEEPEEENLPVFNQMDPTVQATPVGPYTSWDYRREGLEKKQEASFAGFVQQREQQQETKETPLPQTLPPQAESPLAQELGLQEVSETEAEPMPGLNVDEQLLLLKSHELLLTLTDGVKKVAAAKTESARKEKLTELLTAVKLLDVKSGWEEYKGCFEKMHPGFWNNVERLSNEEMTAYELRLCALLSLGMGTKEIAELTNRSVRTVETAIYKIRKKLNIDTEDKTQEFLSRLRSR